MTPEDKQFVIDLLNEFGHSNNCAFMCNRNMQCDCGLQEQVIEQIESR